MTTDNSILKHPWEILEMILGHLDDSASSKQAALVCPKFYEVICCIRRKKPQALYLVEKVWKLTPVACRRQ